MRFLVSRWDIPLLAPEGLRRPPAVSPQGILRAALGGRDARLIMATALWLSLVGPDIEIGGEWSDDDRRRIGYLCDVARCLRRLRGEDMRGRPPSWPGRVAGIRPGRRQRPIPLFDSVAPVLPASMLGIRWMVSEVISFSDHAAFQRLYLRRLSARVRAA